MKVITAPIQAITDLTMVLVHITVEAQWWSRLAIAPTTAVLAIGQAIRITSGNLATGCGGMVRKFGGAATTLYVDID